MQLFSAACCQLCPTGVKWSHFSHYIPKWVHQGAERCSYWRCFRLFWTQTISSVHWRTNIDSIQAFYFWDGRLINALFHLNAYLPWEQKKRWCLYLKCKLTWASKLINTLLSNYYQSNKLNFSLWAPPTADSRSVAKVTVSFSVADLCYLWKRVPLWFCMWVAPHYYDPFCSVHQKWLSTHAARVNMSLTLAPALMLQILTGRASRPPTFPTTQVPNMMAYRKDI